MLGCPGDLPCCPTWGWQRLRPGPGFSQILLGTTTPHPHRPLSLFSARSHRAGLGMGTIYFPSWGATPPPTACHRVFLEVVLQHVASRALRSAGRQVWLAGQAARLASEGEPPWPQNGLWH